MRTEQNRRQIGAVYEQKAAVFLRKQGLCILEQNYRCRLGEVDLIAKDDRMLVFVEVKYRRHGGSGSALGAVDVRKQRTIAKTAQYYLLTHCGTVEVPCRFDVVGFDGKEIQWIRNAFDAE